MGPPSSSKNPDKDPIRKKKIKSKSAKSSRRRRRRRRRRDSSVSSYSSSDSEYSSRSRRKKSTKSKKSEKRRKETKKRRSRKRRHPSVSDVSSYTSRSCSTCSDSSRSRSPVRRTEKKSKKQGKRVQERGRRMSRHSRYRSPSCSTCSGGGRSRSSSRGRRPVKEGVERTRSWSPIEERFGGNESLIEERYRGNDSPIDERAVSNRGWSPMEERHSEKDEKKRLRSVLAVPKPLDEEDDKGEMNKAYDGYPSLRRDDRFEERMTKKRHVEYGDEEKYLYNSQSKDKRQAVKDFDVGHDDSFVCGSKEESEVVGDDNVKEAADLELILRQKALENFRKFRGGVAANKRTVGDKNNKRTVGEKKDETWKLESSQDSKSSVKASDSKHPSCVEDQKLVQEESHPSELKATSVQNEPIEKIKGSTIQSISNNSGSLKPIVCSTNNQKNHVKRAEVSSNNLSSVEASLAKDINKKVFAQSVSGKASGDEVPSNNTDRLASRASNTENQNSEPNEPTVEFAKTGSQFEQKTFSRMHDGEVVQVSYKVYIPKKTPALARRQFQR